MNHRLRTPAKAAKFNADRAKIKRYVAELSDEDFREMTLQVVMETVERLGPANTIEMFRDLADKVEARRIDAAGNGHDR